MATFFSNVCRVIRYLPIIWKDRDYDFYFLLNITHKKLEEMHKFWIGPNTHVVSATKIAKQILVAKELIKRLKNNEYDDLFHKKLHDQFGESRFVDKTLRYENETKENRREINKIHKQMRENEKYMFAQDLDLFCILLKKHLKKWWD